MIKASIEDYNKIFLDKSKLRILVRIIAHLMGDGCVSKRYFVYYNKNQTLIDNFENDINLLFGVHVIKGKVNSGALLRMVQNKEIHTFLKSLHPDYRSHSLYIPKFVNDKDLLTEFLRALFDDEGCVALRIFKKTNEIKRNLTFSSNSLRLVEDIKKVLERIYDIKSNRILRYVKNRDNKVYTNYVLSITGKSNFDKFKSQINFSHPNKKDKLDLMVNSYIRLSATN